MTDKRLEFSDFYAAARDDCLQIVLVTVGDRQLAEDLVAEAFTRAWASWRAVRRHPAPRAWVVRTADVAATAVAPVTLSHGTMRSCTPGGLLPASLLILGAAG